MGPTQELHSTEGAVTVYSLQSPPEGLDLDFSLGAFEFRLPEQLRPKEEGDCPRGSQGRATAGPTTASGPCLQTAAALGHRYRCVMHQVAFPLWKQNHLLFLGQAASTTFPNHILSGKNYSRWTLQ